jgi:DNA-binding transcriptional MerR regulator
MDDAPMPIGAFSRASSLSVVALRGYHESGLLVPAGVDPQTGYRRYHVSPLIDAAVILELRGLELPLGEVQEILRASTRRCTSSSCRPRTRWR